MLDGMSDSIQRSRIENLNSREVDRQSPTGTNFISDFITILHFALFVFLFYCTLHCIWYVCTVIWRNKEQ